MKSNKHIPWLNDNKTILRFIRKLITELDELQQQLLELNEGDVLFTQGEPLEDVYLILEGEVRLTRTQADESDVTLTKLSAGNFVGLIAFTTGELRSPPQKSWKKDSLSR